MTIGSGLEFIAMAECAICKYLPGHVHVCPAMTDEWVNTRTGERFKVTATSAPAGPSSRG